MVYNLWKRLPSQQTVILAPKLPSSTSKDIDRDINVVRRKYPLGQDIFSRIGRTLLVIKNTLQISIVNNLKCIHCAQVISSGVAGLVVKKWKGIPYIVYVYSADILEFSKHTVTRWILEKVLKEAEGIISCSQFAKDILVEKQLALQDKITVVSPGVNIDAFDKGNGTINIKEKYNIPTDCKMLLTVSRLADRKGHENVINTLPQVIDKYPEFVYVIAGSGYKMEFLKELVKNKKLGDKVIFTGAVSSEDLVAFYNACDIFIMTPNYLPVSGDVEGFGIVFLEANACCKPVIAGDTGGVKEAVVGGETGILVDPASLHQIEQAILKLLKDDEYANKLGHQGFVRVKNEFNWEDRALKLKRYV